ncbi:hypothetical protein COU18_03840, partial [Candidatus Kaiserbacteria bacterium CG10_big_fil_rev_8_21_14_0_10_51_14]
MSEEIFFDGRRYISANEAASSVGFTRDYIARMCRQGKIKSRRVAKNWYVDYGSFQDFLITRTHSKSLRQESLKQERVEEYRKGISSFIPAQIVHTASLGSERANEVHKLLSNALTSRVGKSIEPVSHLSHVPAGFTQTALFSHVPGSVLSPFTEFLHKAIALVSALLLTFGTYAIADQRHARFVLDSVQENIYAVRDAYHAVTGGGIAALTQRAETHIVAVAQNPVSAYESMRVALRETVPSTISYSSQVANVSFSTLRDLIATPIERLRTGWAALRNRGGNVSVSIVPYTPVTQTPKDTSTIATVPRATSPSIIQNQPVIERIRETERIVVEGGLTEELLSARLNDLNNRLTSQMMSLSAANSTSITNNVYQSLGPVTRVDSLTSVELDMPVITDGTIVGTAISAESLTVTGTATSTFANGLDISDGCFAIDGTCISGSGGGSATGTATQVQFNDYGSFGASAAFTFATTTEELSVTRASSTYATSTSLFATTLQSTNATTTSFAIGNLAT